MGECLAGDLDPGGVEQNRPVHRVEPCDLLAHEVDIRWPIPPELLRGVEIPESRDVVRQGVNPHIDHMAGVERDWNTPGERGPTDRQIPQPRADERYDLVAALGRLNPLRMRLDIPEPPILVLGEAEQVCVLGRPLQLFPRVDAAGAVRALLRVRVKLLARRAVPTFVLPAIDVACLIQPLKQRGDYRLMARLGRPDEIVIRDVQKSPQLFELGGHPIAPLLRRHAVLPRHALDVHAVFIGARQKEDVVSRQTLEARGYVGGNRRIGVPDMRHVIHVVDRCRDVKALGVHASHLKYKHPSSTGREVPLVVPPSFAHPRLMAGTGAKALRYPDPLTGVWRHTLLGFGVQLRSHVPYRPPTGSHPSGSLYGMR